MTALLAGLAVGFVLGLLCRLRPYVRGVRAGQALTENALGREVTDFPAAVSLLGRLLNPHRAPPPLVDRFNIQHFRSTDEPRRPQRP